MDNLDLYFDLRVDGVLMLDPEKLVPADPDASWLLRETADGWTQRRRLDLARADLDRLRAGWRPSNENLASASMLRGWRVVPLGAILVLEGTVTRHPGIRDGRRALTSALIAVDASDKAWVRTVSRFYALGSPRGIRRMQ